MLPLPKSVNPEHMRTNAAVDFEISGEDMEKLKNAEPIKGYGEASMFPVFGENNRAENTSVCARADAETANLTLLRSSD
jgi:hypothetical protein